MRQQVTVAGILCLALHAGAQDCPDGSYRSSVIVFSCGGGYGFHNFSLAPAATSAPMAIPLGAEGFRISASSSSGPLSLKLRDDANHVLVAAQDHGLVNQTVRAGVYKDVGIIMSKSAALPEDNVSLYLLGALTSPMELMFCNLAENSSARVTIAYTFERVLECSFPPAGCSEYHKDAARWQVEVWSHWASSHYDNATEAWHFLAESFANEKGVRWSSWPSVWASFIGNSSAVVGEEWQPAFAYLDTNGDGHVSEDEFAAGFSLSSSKARAQEEVKEAPDIVSDATEAVRSNRSLDYMIAAFVAALLCFCIYWWCRPKRGGVARSVSQLSRDGKVGRPPRAGAHGPPAKGDPKPKVKMAGPGHPPNQHGNINGASFDHDLPRQKAPIAEAGGSNGLWLFPQIGQALPGFGSGLHQESFRYSPLAVQEDPYHMQSTGGSFSMQAVPRSTSQESFSGPSGTWSNTSQIPQLGSFSLPPPGPLNPTMAGSPTHVGMPMCQDPWVDPMWQSRSLNQGFFQVDLPRTDGIFHQAFSPPLQQVNPALTQTHAGVLQAELAGPVQVESPAPETKPQANEAVGEDGWDRIAEAIVSRALNSLRAELNR